MHSSKGLQLLVVVVAALVGLPLAVVLASLAHPDPAIWAHLTAYVLPELLLNTLLLCAGTLLLTVTLGVSLAWLTALYRFPGANFFAWALMLPLAVPAYVLAFVQTGLFDYGGPVRSLVAATGLDLPVPEARSLTGAILVMSGAFYPYVYMLARNAFQTQGARALEVAQSLGYSRRAGFWKVALPLARPWIATGALLVLMETLADFGAVSIVNVDTFSTAIYKAWFSLFSLPTALQLASMLVFLAFVLIALEQHWRGKQRYAAGSRVAPMPRQTLSGLSAFLASGYCLLVLAITFLVPMIQLLIWAGADLSNQLDARYFGFVGHSLLLGLLTALLVLVVALLLAHAKRRLRARWAGWFIRMAGLGYAIPGAVLAVGVFAPVAWLDRHLITVFGLSGSSVFKGTLALMLLAYLLRFLAVGLNPLHSAYERLSPSQELAARSLGVSGWRLLLQVHLPALRGGLATAFLLVLVDVMKEMPITLMTRPFGWDTLALRIFELTSEGQWQLAALPAVALVLTGMVPVWLLSRTLRTPSA